MLTTIALSFCLQITDVAYDFGPRVEVAAARCTCGGITCACARPDCADKCDVVVTPRPLPKSPPPLHYRTDATGRRWSSPDAAWLERYVGMRNAALRPVYLFQGGCAGGRCGR